jgi:hypothetical protein
MIDSDGNLWLAFITLAIADLTATKEPLKRSGRAWSFRRIEIQAVSFGSAIALALNRRPSGADNLT